MTDNLSSSSLGLRGKWRFSYRLYRLPRPTNLSETDLTTFAWSPPSVPLRASRSPCKASSLTKAFLSSSVETTWCHLCGIYIFTCLLFETPKKSGKIKSSTQGVLVSGDNGFITPQMCLLGEAERGSTSRHQTIFVALFWKIFFHFSLENICLFLVWKIFFHFSLEKKIILFWNIFVKIFF